MSDPLALIPLDAIDPAAILRDRTGYDPEPLAELIRSLAASGLRQPIEVFPLATPRHGHQYGLLSGARRLAAFRTLRDGGDPAFASIPAFIRPARTDAETLAAMIEENAVRAEISPWEQALVARRSVEAGTFPTLDAAVDALYPAFNRDRRRRIRAVASVVEELDDHLATPEKLTQNQLLRLATAIARGYAPVMQHALAEARSREHAAQWTLLNAILLEAEDPAIPDPAPSGPRGRPRRLYRTPSPRRLAIRRERTADGWTLHFTGRDAEGDLIDRIFDEIERMFLPG